jgi:predicted ATPase/DNA-binding SARP family transcriptional activator
MLRILGGTEVGDRPASGGPKQRALLALLALHANELVPGDRLVEDLWGDAAPQTARHAVQVYASRLRKELVAIGARLEADAGGYRLSIDPAALDARAFERLAADGRRALQAGERTEAAATLRRALALWRGPALADVRYEPFAQADIARLEELRLAATEDRIDADLGLGRHAELVAELEGLVAAEPLRERLRGQLMLGLYRAGRQADALAAYRDGARTLRDELGLEPGPELRRLEAAILRQDPELEPAQARSHLPAPVTPLVGRRAEIDAVLAMLRGGARLVTLTGPGGIGKTRLALEVAAGVPDRETWFVGLAAVRDPALVPSEISHALSLQGDPLEALAEHLRTRRALLVLDNFEQVADAADDVSGLLRECAGLTVLATSRSPLQLYGEHVYAVPALGAEESVGLFVQRARAARHTFNPTPAVEAICARLDGLPLAIELAAAQARTLDPDALLAALPDALATPGARDLPARQRTLRATMAWSHELLRAAEAQAFRRLGVFSGGWEPDAAEAVTGATPAVLASLADQSLIGRQGHRHEMLETIREYALERLDAAGEAAELAQRHAEHFLALAESADRELRTGGDQTAALERLEREHDNLRAALDRADPGRALRLGAALASFWAVRGHVAEGRRRLERAIERAREEDPALAGAFAGAGVLARCEGDYAAARRRLARSAELHREREDASGLVRALTNLGFVESLEGDGTAARERYEEALQASERSPHHRDRIPALSCLADLALRDGDFARAEELCVEGLARATEVGDVESQAVCGLNRAYAALGLGRTEDVVAFASQAMGAWASLGDPAAVANALDTIAAALAASRPEEAAELLGAADELRAPTGTEPDWYERDIRQRAEEGVRTRIGPEGLAAGLARGRERGDEFRRPGWSPPVSTDRTEAPT